MLNSLINQHLGRYVITALLGRGGMAAVYRAHDPVLQRDVALKVLYPQYTDEQTLVERFKREAIMAAGLEHPNIVPVYDVGEQDGLVYIAMKLLSGYSLYDVLNQRRVLPLAELLPVLEQVASALDYAHARGVVHRDIKPGNIILELPRRATPLAVAAPVAVAGDAPTAQGVLPALNQPPPQPDTISPGTVAILTDFGIAKSLDTPGLTTTGAMLGTPDYMAPEQISGGRVDRRTDVYALGVLTYRALTGQRPFGGATQDVLLSHLHTTPDDPSLVNPQVPSTLDAVILCAMAKQPSARYASAGEFVQALRAASVGRSTPFPSSVPLADQTTRTTQPRTYHVAAPQALTRPATPVPTQEVPRQPQSNTLLLAGLVVALLLIAGGLIANGAARLFGGSGQVSVAQSTTATQDGAGIVIVPTESPTVSASATVATTTTTEPATPSAQPASPTQQATVATEGPAATATPVIVKQTVVVTQPPPPPPPATKTLPPPPTNTPIPPTDTVAPPTATVPPPTDTATPEPVGCDDSPLRQGSGFTLLYESDIGVRGKIGCPAKPGGEKAGKAADMIFANGTMYWWEALDTVYVLPEGPNRAGKYRAFNKAEAAALPEPPAEIDPKIVNKGGGFARVYYGVPEIREAIGAPVTAERPINGAYQAFENGIMIYSPANDTVRGKTIYVLYNDGTFKRYDDLNPD